jgi:hypothetical protein
MGSRSEIIPYRKVFWEKEALYMRKMIIPIMCLILFLASLAWEQEKVEAPVINVGSKWTYRADNGQEWMDETIGEEKDLYIFLTTGKSEWKRYYDKKNMNCVKVLRDGKEDKDDKNRLKKRFDFPLYLGKKWKYLYTVFSPMTRKYVDTLTEVSVLGFEDVSVMAGRFRAIKIRNEINAIGGCHCRDKSYRKFHSWYSPDVKALIKFEREPGAPYTYDYMKYELVSFELK